MTFCESLQSPQGARWGSQVRGQRRKKSGAWRRKKPQEARWQHGSPAPGAGSAHGPASSLSSHPSPHPPQPRLILEGGERWHLSPPVSQQAVQPGDADKGAEEQSQLLSEAPVFPR